MTDPQFQPYPPLPPGPPDRQVSRRRRIALLTVIAMAASGAWFTAGFAVGRMSADDDSAPSSSETTVSTAEEAVPEVDIPEPESTYATVGPDDFDVDLVVKSKKCYGSVGCNVTVKPELGYNGDSSELDPDLTYEITFKITGGDDGPVTETLTLTNQDDVNYSDVFMSTGSSGAELSAEVTLVDEY